MLALLKALHLAYATVKKCWPQTAAPTTVLILLGQPCKEIMDIITHHIEHGPESYKSLQDPHRSTVKKSSNASIRSGALVSRSLSRCQITTTRAFNLRRHKWPSESSNERVTMRVNWPRRRLDPRRKDLHQPPSIHVVKMPFWHFESERIMW
jgi:hypothetical protein